MGVGQIQQSAEKCGEFRRGADGVAGIGRVVGEIINN